MELRKLKAAAFFARRKEKRFPAHPLACVRVEPGRLLATSAQAAIIIKHDSDAGPLHLDPGALRLVRDNAAKVDGTRFTSGVVTVDAKSDSPISGFPDIDAAIAPMGEVLESPVVLSVHLLEQLVNAAKTLGVEMLRVQIPKDGGKGRLTALRVTPMRDESFVAIIMPCRID